MVVGQPGGDSDDPQAWVYERFSDGWVRVATLGASDAFSGNTSDFGYSVAIDGDWLIAGDPQHGALHAEGAAYAYRRQPNGSWLEAQILLPPESDTYAMGWAVDLEGDMAIVGAKGASIGSGHGKAFSYQLQGSTWVKLQTLGSPLVKVGDGFGSALALDGDHLVVGAPYLWSGSSTGVEGRAFLYRRIPSSLWVPEATFAPADLANHDAFGADVAIDGDTALVGAPEHDLPVPNAGAVYGFELIGGVWTQTDKFTPGDLPHGGTQYGWSLDLQGSHAVVGAWRDDDQGYAVGAAYVFEYGPQGWSETEKVHGSGLETGDTFGWAVDMDGSNVLITAPNADVGYVSPGRAQLFSYTSGPSLLADTPSLSLSQGGDQTLNVGASKAHAGSLYLVGGSAAGTSPGFVFGGTPVPLNPDAYFLYTVNHVGAPPLADSFGALDENGFAQASFAIPPGTSPSLAGLTLHHAYAVLDCATLQLDAVSPAVPVELVP